MQMAILERIHMQLVKSGDNIAVIHNDWDVDFDKCTITIYMDYYPGGDLEDAVRKAQPNGYVYFLQTWSWSFQFGIK
jgi:hypothetical protein